MTVFDSVQTNILADGEVAGRSPDAEGDFYTIADAQADHNYWQEKIVDSILATTLTPNAEFLIIYGGVVTDSGSGQVDISECVAIGKNGNGDRRLIRIPALTNISIPSGWNDGRSIWVRARHDFKLGTATRAHRAGTSYHYQIQDTYMGDSNGYVSTGTDDLFVDADPVATDVILGKFTMTGTTFADLGVRTYTFDQDTKNRLYPVGSFYVQYPDAASNDDATAFPTSARPATMFGGTWVEQFSTEYVFFRTGGASDGATQQTRTSGLSADQFEDHYHDTLSIGHDTSGGVARTSSSQGGSVTGYSIIRGATTNGTYTLRTGATTEPRNRLIKLWKRTVL